MGWSDWKCRYALDSITGRYRQISRGQVRIPYFWPWKFVAIVEFHADFHGTFHARRSKCRPFRWSSGRPQTRQAGPAQFRWKSYVQIEAFF
jgi:hypothetical protein